MMSVTRRLDRDDGTVIRPLSILACLTLVLTACFNGDPGLGSDTDTSVPAECPTVVVTVPPTTNPALNPGVFVFKRAAVTVTPEAFVAQANAQGALGYRFSDVYAGSDDPSELYICDTANPTAWKVETELWTPGQLGFQGLVDLLNKKGTNGFRYQGRRILDNTDRLVFVKNETRTDKFEYRLSTLPLTTEIFLRQANEQGNDEFRFTQFFQYTSIDTVALYRRNKVSPHRLRYEAATPAETPAAFVNQANARGAEGFRYFADFNLDAGGLQAFYIKDLTTPGVFAASTQPVPATLGSLLSQANTQGAKGLLRIADGQWANASQANRTIYLDLNQCRCEPLELADPLVD